MPRYFFNHLKALADGAEDIEGEELANDEAAWHEATLMLGDLAKDIDENSGRGKIGRWK